MSFIINRPDGTKQKVSGYKKSKVEKEIKRFGSKRLSNKNLPSRVDLRKYMTDIENQGETSSCVANAVAGAYEYLAKREQNIDDYNASRLFIYYNARDLDEEFGDIADEGSCINIAIQSLKEYGVCSEDTWPFDEDDVNEEPDEDSYNEAEWFIVEDVTSVPLDLQAWKECLAAGYPIIFGLDLYQSFDSHKRPGLVPMPTQNEINRGEHAGHAMLAVGYSDKEKVFIVRNSWGEDWGDSGYCYIPYDYIINEEYADTRGWVVKQIEDLDIDEDSWDEDDDSIFPDFESELADMSDEDYQEFLNEMGDYPLEYRLAILFVYAAGQDDDVSDEEWDEIYDYLSDIFDRLASQYEAEKVIDNVLNHWEEDEDKEENILYETVRIFGEYLSEETLQLIAEDLETVIGEDDLSEEEEEFIDFLWEEWELEDEDEDD